MSGPGPEVLAMFARIARRYDLLNSLMSFGRDRAWRRAAIRAAAVPEGGRLLDIGAGTGSMAREALRLAPRVQVVACDPVREMVEAGRRRRGLERASWCLGDALRLPFGDGSFDAAVSGFVMRNVPDLGAALREQARVVKPGGRVVVLDTSPPRRGPLRPAVAWYLGRAIPLLGSIVAGDRAAYAYLAESTRRFVEPEELARVMGASGLEAPCIRRFMLGAIAVVSAARQLDRSAYE